MLRIATLLAVTFLPPHSKVTPGPGAGHDPVKRWVLVAQSKDGGNVGGLSQD